MAVIFFDGFNRTSSEPLPIDTYYWTPTGASHADNDSIVFTMTTPVVNNIKLGNIGTHSGKKLYLGVRVYSYSVSTGLGSVGQPFLSFYDDTDTAVLDVNLTTDSVSYPNLGFIFRQANTSITTYTALNSTASLGWTTCNVTNGFMSNARVFEFEIDLTANTVAMRYEGQTLQNSAAASLTSISSIANIAGLKIYGGSTTGCIVPPRLYDMYLIDSTGSFANTWLGANFTIHAPALANGYNFVQRQWDSVPYDNSSYINQHDSDSSYVRTGEFDKYIIANMDNIAPGGTSPKVAGIRVGSVARKVTLDSAYKYAYRNQSTNTNYDMGQRIVLTDTAYKLAPAQFITTNPETNAQWTVAEVNAGGFGLKSVDPS